MATITPVAQDLNGISSRGRSFLWETLTVANADGGWIPASGSVAIGFAASGTWDSNTLTFQGSHMADKSLPFTLTTLAGDPAELTANGALSVADLPLWIRPITASGTTVDLDVTVFLAG
jgi:hypothetical protein